MQNIPRPWIIVACTVLLMIVSCRTKNVEPPTPAPLVSLSVAPVNTSIAPGTTVQMTATGTFADNGKRNVTASVTWTSSDPGIADVSNAPGSQGLVTAATTTGSTVISAVSGGITGTTTLSTSQVNSITVTPSTPPCIAPGTTQQFAATGTLKDSTKQNLTSFATWTSSDTGVAIVSDTQGSKGLATAVSAPGIASIQATYNLIPGSTTLTSAEVASIVTSPTGTSIAKGTTQQFTAIGTLTGNCNTQDVTSLATWTTSNTAVATVSDTPGSKGLATAVDVGTAAITATIDSGPSSSATLTVTPAMLVSIDVTPANKSVPVGQNQQFIAIGNFTDKTTQDLSSLVTWNSSNAGVATISNISGSRGLATPQAEGTTTITASFSGITSNDATLTITPAELVSITIETPSASVSLGSGSNSAQFKATGAFSDGNTQVITTSVKWVSTNANIPISNTGKAVDTFFLLESTDITASSSGITSNTFTLTFIP